MNIPFVNLAKQFTGLETELTQAFLDVGRSGIYIMGERLEEFESNVARFCDTPFAIGVADGSAALFLVLKAMGVGPGDEVITATNSFIASAWVIAATGAKPVLVDIGGDFNIHEEHIVPAITSRTRAIIPVHLTGRPAPMDEINALAQKYNCFVLEDAAQAIGAKYKGRRVGSLGLAAGFSLHPLKNLGVYGDGGFITTSDPKLNVELRKLRNHGLKNRDECELWGFNSRLDTLQAAFAGIKLKQLVAWNQRCREIAAMYRDGIEDFVDVPVDQDWEECVYHNFVIRSKYRDQLIQFMKDHGIDTRIHYPIPIHLQEAAKDLGYSKGDFPNAESYALSMLSLPIYPELTNEEIQYVINIIKSFFR
jgi:dTDP-4-amino-4,6-dideoxygalactose transaminase